eukprot:4351853-Heterocapsa_arctica.AAC.1
MARSRLSAPGSGADRRNHDTVGARQDVGRKRHPTSPDLVARRPFEGPESQLPGLGRVVCLALARRIAEGADATL